MVAWPIEETKKKWKCRTSGRSPPLLSRALPESRVRGPRPPAVYLCTLIYSFFLHFSDIIARCIRSASGIISSMRSARVDLLRSRLYFVDFWSGLAVPSENMHFQHPEPLKNQVFRTFANFLRRASSSICTEPLKACKICIFFWYLLIFIQLRRCVGNTLASLIWYLHICTQKFKFQTSKISILLTKLTSQIFVAA